MEMFRLVAVMWSDNGWAGPYFESQKWIEAKPTSTSSTPCFIVRIILTREREYARFFEVGAE